MAVDSSDDEGAGDSCVASCCDCVIGVGRVRLESEILSSVRMSVTRADSFRVSCCRCVASVVRSTTSMSSRLTSIVRERLRWLMSGEDSAIGDGIEAAAVFAISLGILTWRFSTRRGNGHAKHSYRSVGAADFSASAAVCKVVSQRTVLC